MAFPQIICETNNDECLKYIMDLTLSSTYQRFIPYDKFSLYSKAYKNVNGRVLPKHYAECTI